MAFLSNDLIYSAIVVFALAFIFHAIETAWSVRSGEGRNLDRSRTERLARNATGLIFLADLILLAGLITRGLSAERLPLGNMYEFSITGAFAFTTAYLIALKKFQIRWLGLFVAAGALLTLGTAVTLLYVESAPLVPALKSPWIVIHVSAAIISGGIFLLANSIAAIYLILEKIEGKGARGNWSARLPSLDALDQLTYRLIALVFP
ncbi:MAG: c-type cytochrome biosis protein CcsB, partial [Actinomycetota bacterium]